MPINIESASTGVSSFQKQNSFFKKNSLLQTLELPDSYIEILTSSNFILLMVICFLCLSVPITILIQFCIEKQRKIKEEKFPYRKNDFKKIDERKKALDFMQMDSINLIKYGFCIVLLLQIIDGIFSLISIVGLSSYHPPNESISFGKIFFNFLSTFLPIFFEIAASLLIGIGLIKLARKDIQKKQVNTLGIFWLIWIIFSPFTKLALFIITNNLEYLTEYDIYFSVFFWFKNEAIFFTFTILFVLRAIITSLILYFSAKILQLKELIKTKGLLVAYSLIIWFLSSVIYILTQLFETVLFGDSTLGWAISGLLFGFIYAYLIIPPILAIFAVIILVKEFKLKQQKEKEFLVRSKHDILSLSDIFSNKSIFFQNISLDENLKFLTQFKATEFDEDILRNFKSRLDDHIFILFMNINKRPFPNFLIDFIKMNKMMSEINTLFYTKIHSKKIPFLSNLKWNTLTDLESIIEFNFDKLPCIFILDRFGNELGIIKGKLEHEQTLVEELIFYLDVGLFI